LNHEFLADEKVVHSYNNVPFYQSLLLSKANANPTFYLASNLNYILTKKRLLMMTKTTSKRKALLKKAMLLPLFTLVAVISCKKEQRDKGIDTKKNITEIAAIGTAANLTEPQFPGGLKNFYKFISANFKTDGNFKKEEIMASFIIESDGSISQIKIKNRILDKTKEEAIRVLKLSPKWNPARVDEKPVRYQFVLPITIEGKT
ncbi:MAG: M56 family peptidase, partial [Flavobacterium sp.]